MALEFHWQLPAKGDGRYGRALSRRRGERSPSEPSPIGPGVSDPRGERFNYFDHLHQIARAAELSGFDGLQIEHDPLGDESWVIASYLARDTRRIQLVTQFEASWGSPVYAAKNTATFQRYTGGRQAWFLLPGPAAEVRRRAADPVADADVLPRIDEFLEVARGVLTGAPYTFKGRFFEVFEGGFREGLDNQVVPTIYLGGTSPEALTLAAERADVHVLPLLPVPQLREIVARLDQLARAKGRVVRHALQTNVLARETSEEAAADGRWQPHPEAVKGSYAQVAERLTAYREAGIDTFLLSALPHLEEAYRLGAHLLPLLRDRQIRPTTSPAPLGVNP